MIRTMFATGFVCLTLLTPLRAQNRDQSYGKWQKDPGNPRYYCEYHYQPSPTGPAGVQLVVYDPKDPGWVYWLNPPANPYNKKGEKIYWARCPTKANPAFGKLVKEGKDVWSILPAAKRQGDFSKLKSADFPEPKAMSPQMPNQNDPKRTIACPPSPDPGDLPE